MVYRFPIGIFMSIEKYVVRIFLRFYGFIQWDAFTACCNGNSIKIISGFAVSMKCGNNHLTKGNVKYRITQCTKEFSSEFSEGG